MQEGVDADAENFKPSHRGFSDRHSLLMAYRRAKPENCPCLCKGGAFFMGLDVLRRSHTKRQAMPAVCDQR
jgi:hypothetical protein